jgi:gliding motility-associated-like protein
MTEIDQKPQIIVPGKIVIYPDPVAEVSGEGSFCIGETVTLEASSVSGELLVFEWLSPDGTTHSGSRLDLGEINLNHAGTYSLKAINKYGCESITEVEVNIILGPTINMVDVDSICSNEYYQIGDIMVSDFANTRWSTDGDGRFNNTTHLNAIYQPGRKDIINGSVRLTLTAFSENEDCREASAELLLYILPAPEITEIIVTEADCDEATGIISIVMPDLDYPVWFSIDNGTTWFTDPVFDSLPHGSYYISVIDYYGCQTSFEYDPTVVPQPADCERIQWFIPNAFTPNGDGLNDTFGPVWVANAIPTQYNMQIFSKWGQLIFETDDPLEGWDGTYQGVLLPKDTYAYIIRLSFSSTKDMDDFRGTATLIR